MSKDTKYGLLISDINDIISVLTQNQKIEKIVLFGSRAKGNFSPGSDIDIAVFGKKLTTFDVIDVLALLDELFLPYKFDIVIFERIKEDELKKHINRAGKLLYEKKQS